LKIQLLIDNITSHVGIIDFERSLVEQEPADDDDDIDEDLLDIESLPERVDRELVGCHHDGRVGDLPHQLGPQAPVQTPPTLLLVN